MDCKKARSSLRKSIVDVGIRSDVKTQQKRRISFSGKNSVRIFHGEEEPRTWNNSYEISDHLNVNETKSTFCASSSTTKLLSAVKNDSDHTENIDQSLITHQMLEMHTQQQKNSADLSITSNLSALSSTKDLINVSYRNQNSKICQIDNSVDITLCEREKKFQHGKVKSSSKRTNLCSFSLEDYQTEDPFIMPGERNLNFIQEAGNHTSIDFTFNSSINSKLPLTIYTSDSLSISDNDQISSTNINANKEENIPQSAMQLLSSTDQRYDKENVDPFTAHNANETQNNSCEMEMEDELFSHSQANVLNVKRELIVFPNKQNKLSLLQESNDDKQACNTSNYDGVKIKNQRKLKNNSIQSTDKNSEKNFTIQKLKSRPTINFNTTIALSPNKSTKKWEEKRLSTIYGDSFIHDGTPEVNLRHTLNFNKTMDISPPKVNTNLQKKTVNLSFVKLSHAYVSDLNLSVSESAHKYGQQPKLVDRKICTPLKNKTKNAIDVEQHSLIGYKKKQDKISDALETEKLAKRFLNFSLDNVKNITLESESSTPLMPLEFKGYSLRQLNDEIECGKIKIFSNDHTFYTDQKRRMSVSNFHSKNVQLTQSTTKPTTTLLFEDVDINLSSDDALQPNLKSKSENVFDFNITQCKAKERKSNGKYRYSEADDMMLENTSFLTRAKLSDETVSRNNSKRSLTQLNDVMDIFDESLMKTSSKLENHISEISLQTENSCNKENNTLKPIFENAKPIFTQTKIKTSDCNNDMNLSDTMDISNEFEKDSERGVNISNLHPCLSILLQTEETKQQSTQTTYFDNDIVTEKDLSEAKESADVEKSEKELIENPALLQNLSVPNEANIQAKETDENIYNSISSRKTLYFNDEISLIEDLKDIDAKNSNLTKQTLYFNNETCELEETIQVVNQKLSHPRKSVHTAQDMSVTFMEDIPKTSKSIYPYPNKTDIIDFNLSAVDRNKFDANQLKVDITKISTATRSIHTPRHVDLKLNGEELNENREYIDLHMMNLSLDGSQPIENVAEYKNDNRKTLFSKGNNNLSLDQSFKPAEIFEFPDPTVPLNNAKITFTGQICENYLTNISHSTNKQESLVSTPMKYAGSNDNHTLFCITPRLSLLEFTALEKKAREEEDKYIYPLRTESFNKRHPANLTPILPIPKRRQPLMSAIEDSSNFNIPKEKPSDVEMEMIEKKNKEKPNHINKCAKNDDAIKISRIIPKESVLQTPQKEQKSRIPISISSGNKTNKSFPINDSIGNNHKERNIEVYIEEADNLAESIQLMRRNSTFMETKDSAIGQLELDADFVPAGKPSIFEGNPITISDVSVFFETQRRGNSNVLQTEVSFALEKTGTDVTNATENLKNDLGNRYINLSLEDIDKTRLSLVRISYENDTSNVSGLDQEDNGIEEQSLSNDAVTNEKVESTINLKNTRNSVSQVCRKCKRCQEILKNETTSSISESFTLPALRPLPDIGMDHLRRLRKLPTITSVHSLWQRASLDSTISNDSDISDNGSKIICNTDDETEDKDSIVTNFIRKYEEDIISFEIDLLKNHQNEPSAILSFISRLKALLRTNATNWIIDYQMQYRGILLFSHKKLYTFTLLLTYEEVDSLGYEIRFKSVKLEKGHIPEKNWTPIDFVLDFQLKLNLPFNLQSLCKGTNEDTVLKMLQEVDRVCLDVVKMGNELQRICILNQAYIKRDECKPYVQKVIRKIIDNNDFKFVKKTQIRVELPNLKKLSFRDIIFPHLHHFHEEIHLLSTGLQFLQEFLPNPLIYLKDH